MKMLCFVLPVSACEQCVREIQQNIGLDMLLFPCAYEQYEQGWEKAKGQTVQDPETWVGDFKIYSMS